MTTVAIRNAKFSVVFKAGELPRINPLVPEVVLVLGGVEIFARLNPKGCRKLQSHYGGAVLQGTLVHTQRGLMLESAGWQFLEPKPVETTDGETAKA